MFQILKSIVDTEMKSANLVTNFQQTITLSSRNCNFVFNLLFNAIMESAEKVNMPKLVQKVDASSKFQRSHKKGGIRKCSSFN